MNRQLGCLSGDKAKRKAGYGAGKRCTGRLQREGRDHHRDRPTASQRLWERASLSAPYCLCSERVSPLARDGHQQFVQLLLEEVGGITTAVPLEQHSAQLVLVDAKD